MPHDQRRSVMKRILHLALPAMICAAAAFSMQAQTPLITIGGKAKATIAEFATPSQASLPHGLDIACDGSVWYTETSAGKIAVLRPDHTSAEYTVPNGGQPV